MNSEAIEHIPVLVNEIMAMLITDKNGIYLDGTLGDGGYSRVLLEKLDSSGRVIATDWDDSSVRFADQWKNEYGDRLDVHRANFSDMPRILESAAISAVQGIVLDLGLSSRQLDAPERGFSYRFDGPLTMNMDSNAGNTAFDLINTASWDELKKIFLKFGEERRSGALATIITREREKKAISTTFELVGIMQKYWRPRHFTKSASRIFQALRIAVNHELESLEMFLESCWKFLVQGGRIAVVSYHSLEDRIVKQTFRQHEYPCICPRDFPECRCGKIADAKVLTKRPVYPSEEEITRNSRARSARLRVAEKI